MCKQKNKEYGYWTRERVFEESKKYTTRKEFRKGAGGAYSAAYDNGWLEEMDWIKVGKYGQRGQFEDFNKCAEESKKYKNRSEFKKHSNQAYCAAQKNGWLDKFTWLKNCKDLYKDKVDCIYAYKFEDLKTIYVGRTIFKERRDMDHKCCKRDSIKRFIEDNSLEWPEMEVLEDNLTLAEGIEREGFWIEHFKKEGWVLINSAKAGSLGAIGFGKWTKNTCREEASKYSRRIDFMNGSRGAYNASLSKGWIEEYTWFKKHSNYKMVDQLTLDGKLIKTFNSILAASREIGKSSHSLVSIISGRVPNKTGFLWRYHEESSSDGDPDLNSDNNESNQKS